MKYDSSMTQFHGDIVSAIKSMIHGDIDKVAELAAEGSPVPLRDYLREQHGRCCHGGNKFDCMSSAFLVKFDHMINNLGDTKLQLSWSQTTGFIRKYPSEFFSEEESADEILPDKNSLELLCNTFDESKIECPFWHTGQTMRYVNIGGVDFKCDYCECSFCEFDKLTEFLASHCHDYEECLYYRKHKDDKSDFPCEDCGHDKHGCCDYPDTPDDYCVCGDKKIPVPAQTEAAVPAVFDYSELDADTAAKLENVTAEIFNVRKEYIFTMAKKVAYAHDLLANHYGGKFGTWCESIGISRDTGNNLVRVAELFGNSTIEEQENLNKLVNGNVKLLYEAAKPSAPPELVEQVKSGDITTHKEYIALKKELEQTKDNLRNIEMNFDEHEKLRYKTGEENVQLKIKANELEKELEEAKKSEEKAKAEYEEIFAENNANSRKLSEYLNKNIALERQLKELENRPVDVQIQQPDESTISLQAREMAQGLIRSAESAADKRVREIQQELSKKNKEVTELSEKLREAQASVLDAAFENNSGNSGNDLEQIKGFYEILHSRALSAIKDCFDFIGTDNISSEAVRAIKSRLRTFAEIVDDYINEMEEY